MLLYSFSVQLELRWILSTMFPNFGSVRYPFFLFHPHRRTAPTFLRRASAGIPSCCAFQELRLLSYRCVPSQRRASAQSSPQQQREIEAQPRVVMEGFKVSGLYGFFVINSFFGIPAYGDVLVFYYIVHTVSLSYAAADSMYCCRYRRTADPRPARPWSFEGLNCSYSFQSRSGPP